ncbi:MAG: LamB/YcsF family protein [Methylocystis sp.]
MLKSIRNIDLNSDLGEGFGQWRMGDDEAMLDLVTSANIACGFHAGDYNIMAHCYSQAKQKNVAIGAHVGFPDLAGFGRRTLALSAEEITRLIIYQIGAAQALALSQGHKITYVKAHGALANIAETDRAIAESITCALKHVDPSLCLLAIALSEQTQAGERAGIRTFHEIFADRNYTEQGRLQPRQEASSVITDAELITSRVKKMLESQSIICLSGKKLSTPIDSICLHSDTQHAIDTANNLRQTLLAEGYNLSPFTIN